MEVQHLPNRCGNKVDLVPLERTADDMTANVYQMRLDTDAYYLSVSSTPNGDALAVDPDGGPFICEGYVLPNGMAVTAVRPSSLGYVVTVKNDEKANQ